MLAYLARYTHRVAISNSRLVRLTDDDVTFTWKDYADHDRRREMTLAGEEFLRRFLLHVLPDRFVRIRYFGLLANRHREKALALCRQLVPGPPVSKIAKTDWRQQLESLTGVDPMKCEVCGQPAGTGEGFGGFVCGRTSERRLKVGRGRTGRRATLEGQEYGRH